MRTTGLFRTNSARCLPQHWCTLAMFAVSSEDLASRASRAEPSLLRIRCWAILHPAMGLGTINSKVPRARHRVFHPADPPVRRPGWLHRGDRRAAGGGAAGHLGVLARRGGSCRCSERQMETKLTVGCAGKLRPPAPSINPTHPPHPSTSSTHGCPGGYTAPPPDPQRKRRCGRRQPLKCLSSLSVYLIAPQPRIHMLFPLVLCLCRLISRLISPRLNINIKSNQIR